jgi:hypothetical protein
VSKQRHYPALKLIVIHALERTAPAGRPRIEWKLITDLPVKALSGSWIGRVDGAMKKSKSLYHGHRFPAGVISCAVRWYFRFQLSLRDIEELLFERGVIVTYAPKEVP